MPKRLLNSRRRVLIALGLATMAAFTAWASVAAAECEEAAPELKVTPTEQTFKVNDVMPITVEATGFATPTIKTEAIENTASFKLVKGCKGVQVSKTTTCEAQIECIKVGTGKYEVVSEGGLLAIAALKCT